MKPQKTIFDWLWQKPLVKISARIFTVFCLLGTGYLIARTCQKAPVINYYEVATDSLEREVLRLQLIITAERAYIDTLQDWKLLLLTGTKKEVAEKLRKDKKNRLNN